MPLHNDMDRHIDTSVNFADLALFANESVNIVSGSLKHLQQPVAQRIMQAFLHYFLGQENCRIAVTHKAVVKHTDKLFTVTGNQITKTDGMVLWQTADKLDPFCLGRAQSGFRPHVVSSSEVE